MYLMPDNTILSETAAIVIRDLVEQGKTTSEIYYFLVSNSIPSFSNRPFSVHSVTQAVKSLKDSSYRPNSLAALSFKAISRNVENKKD